jgi:hypothetical protein
LVQQTIQEQLKTVNAKMQLKDLRPQQAPIERLGSPDPFGIDPGARSLFKHLWRKCVTPTGPGTEDDWTMLGTPHEWWDKRTGAPMASFPRFDLQETSYAIALFSQRTPAWTDIYEQMLDGICTRWTTFWAANDFNTQFGDDPGNESYPSAMSMLLPSGRHNTGYNIPGWVGNGLRQEHINTGKIVVEPDVIATRSMLFFKGWFALSYGIRAQITGLDSIHDPLAIANVGDKKTTWTHHTIVETLSSMYLDHNGAGLN